MHRRALAAVASLVAALALAGCSTPQPTTSPTVTTTATVVAQPSASPTATEPSPVATTSASAAPAGCAAGTTVKPGDAVSKAVGDLDGDGRPDSIYYSEGASQFGIATASGAVLPVRDTLAGPGKHTAWAARIAGGAVVMVLSDGRGAELYGLQRSGSGCSLGAVLNPQGTQYGFDQEELRGNGTGVGCREHNGTRLGGYDAHAVGGDRFKVTFTVVTVAPDARSARNGATSVLATSAANDSALVRTAEGSTCGSAPIVGSSGK